MKHRKSKTPEHRPADQAADPELAKVLRKPSTVTDADRRCVVWQRAKNLLESRGTSGSFGGLGGGLMMSVALLMPIGSDRLPDFIDGEDDEASSKGDGEPE